jgi:four helix bundle protein
MGQGAGDRGVHIATAGRKIVTFRDLQVWEDGISLAKAVYALCERLPQEERYGLASQMKRAAISIPSNVAEGHSRNHRREYRQAVYIAIGSLAELETQVHLAQELGFLSSIDQSSFTIMDRINRLRAMLITLGRRL